MLREHLEKKSDNWHVKSRNKLRKSVSHKLKRTFVGCLDVIEKELDLEDEELARAFRKMRYKILGIGNDQIRYMEAELERYNISYIPYTYEMKVVPIEKILEINEKRNRDE